MLPCLKPTTINSQPSSPPLQGGNTTVNTPTSSSQPSPTVNLSREYKLSVQTNSYSEIWSKIHTDESHQENQTVQSDGQDQPEFLTLAQVLHPDQDTVSRILKNKKSTKLTQLISEYFDQSEHTSQLCLDLQKSIRNAKILYSPLYELLSILRLDTDADSDSFSQPQCDRVFESFIRFDCIDNPFPSKDSDGFDKMRECLDQLDHRLRQSKSDTRRFRRAACGIAICLVGTAASGVIFFVTHTFAGVAMLAIPIASRLFPATKARAAQLDAVAKGTYILHKDLDTIDRLVERLHDEVEGDKLDVRFALERGRDKHPVYEVAKRIFKDKGKFLRQVSELEEHLCLCFAAINRSRSQLLQEIHISSN